MKMLRLLLMLLIFGHCGLYTTAYEGAKTLYGEKRISSGKTMYLNTDSEQLPGEHLRSRRDAPQPVLTNSTVKMKVNSNKKYFADCAVTVHNEYNVESCQVFCLSIETIYLKRTNTMCIY